MNMHIAIADSNAKFGYLPLKDIQNIQFVPRIGEAIYNTLTKADHLVEVVRYDIDFSRVSIFLSAALKQPNDL